jgi:protoheme ferro-lyase
MTHHVVLVTYGEPPESDFGAQLKYSWRILLGLTRSVASIPAPLLPLIALSRARSRTRLWTAERYQSPLEPITRDQAAAMAAALAALAPREDWRVHSAYEFRDPLLVDLLKSLPAQEPVDVVPMYVADSAFTHGISRSAVDAWRPVARPAPVRVMPALDEEAFATLAADHVAREIESRGAGGAGWALALAAHGTLLEPPRPYETGRLATERVAAAISRRLSARFGRITLGWLNHVYGGRWTEPAMDEALRQLADAGFKRVVYFPFGFMADNAESQLEGRIALRTQTWDTALHLPCVNAAPTLMEALARQVVEGEGVGVAGATKAREGQLTAT